MSSLIYWLLKCMDILKRHIWEMVGWHLLGNVGHTRDLNSMFPLRVSRENKQIPCHHVVSIELRTVQCFQMLPCIACLTTTADYTFHRLNASRIHSGEAFKRHPTLSVTPFWGWTSDKVVSGTGNENSCFNMCKILIGNHKMIY